MVPLSKRPKLSISAVESTRAAMRRPSPAGYLRVEHKNVFRQRGLASLPNETRSRRPNAQYQDLSVWGHYPGKGDCSGPSSSPVTKIRMFQYNDPSAGYIWWPCQKTSDEAQSDFRPIGDWGRTPGSTTKKPITQTYMIRVLDPTLGIWRWWPSTLAGAALHDLGDWGRLSN